MDGDGERNGLGVSGPSSVVPLNKAVVRWARQNRLQYSTPYHCTHCMQTHGGLALPSTSRDRHCFFFSSRLPTAITLYTPSHRKAIVHELIAYAYRIVYTRTAAWRWPRVCPMGMRDRCDLPFQSPHIISHSHTLTITCSSDSA